MIQGLAPLIMTVSGAVATGAVVYVAVETDIFGSSTPDQKVEQVQTQPLISTPEPEQQAALKVEPEGAIAQPEIAAPALPKFHVLRIERDGSAVIAGEAPANSRVEIIEEGAAIAETTSGAGGDFAIVLDTPLAPGIHELLIRAHPEGQDPVISAEAGLIHVPGSPSEEATVVVVEAGKASRVLQKQKPAPAVEVASAETVEEPAPIAPVLIEAADVENGKIFIAGTGAPGYMVRMYLDGKHIGDTGIQDTGAYLYEGTTTLDPGTYAVRADMVEKGESDVVARAEVELVHQPVVVAEAPEPVEETAATEEAPAKIKTGASVIIRRGDSLWTVSRRNYGEGVRYTTIFEANRDQIRNPHLIFPGQVLKLPDSEETTTQANSG